jgi:hypothetical protein
MESQKWFGEAIGTGGGTMTGKDDRKSHVAETARQERALGGQPEVRESGDPSAAQSRVRPENEEGAAKASVDNDLTTGHSSPGDGGADNANEARREE